MKTYNKTNTFPITHNNEVYSMDIQVSAAHYDSHFD